MKALFHRGLMLQAGFWSLLFLSVLISPSFSFASTASSGTASRWATFEFSPTDNAGDLQVGKPVSLNITLGGVTQGTLPIVALCESVHFESTTVTLEADPDAGTLKATVLLEPLPLSRTSVRPKAARIQVTFARSRQEKLERIMRRIVYVTLDRQEPAGDSSDQPPSRPDDPAPVDLIEETQPDALPVSGGELAEEDLVPFADPQRGRAYWQHISQLISRSWARQVRGIRKGPSSETVRVRFRLFPNGRAQLIEIEKGSGAREIDEAGIYAVVNAQPFPSFPSDLGEESVDVHIRMRTGARPRPRDVQAITNPSSRPDSQGQAPKK